MADTMGMGVCLIPNENGIPCGNQITEGAPIGTVMAFSGPVVGHKRCADSHQYRKANPVKIGKQAGPGGAMGEFEEALASGSVPLEKPDPAPPQEWQPKIEEIKSLREQRAEPPIPIQVWPETANSNRFVHQVYLALAESTQQQGDPTQIMAIAKRAIVEARGTIQ